MLKMLDIKVLTLVCFLTVPAELYYISSSTSNSSEANLSCKLAMPEIVYSQEGRRIVLNKTLLEEGVQLENGSLYWVGYAETYQAFLYLGCATAANVANVSYRDDLMSPGQCYSACKTDTFGIQNFSCHCLSREPNRAALLNIGCNISCNNLDGVLCGGDNAVSIYKKVHYRSLSWQRNTGGACLLIEKEQHRMFYSWAQCNTSQNHTCHDDVEEFLFSNYTGNWSSSVQKCLEYGYNPAGETYNINTISLTVYGGFWTGKIRSYSIISKDDLVKQNISLSEFRQGYIKYIEGNEHLVFEPVSFKLPSICETGTSISATSTSTHSTILPMSTDDKIATTASTKHITFSTTETFTSKSTEQTDTTNIVLMLTSSVSPKGHTDIIVGISTGFALLLLLAGIISAVYLLWRKRSNTGIENVPESGTQSINKYVNIELSEGTRKPNYSPNSLDTDHVTNSEYDTPSAVACFHNYEPLKKMIKKETDDSYDYIEQTKTGIMFIKKRNSNQKNGTTMTDEEGVENMNDHLEADNIEGVYNTTTVATRIQSNVAAADDTYNHIPAKGQFVL